MLDRLTRNWWTFAIQGLAFLAFGVLTVIWPGSSLQVMIALFGAFALVSGVTLMVASFDAAKHRLHWGSLLAAGVLDVLVGVVTWFWPGLTAFAVLYLVVAWALVTGVLYVVASVEFHDEIPHSWLLTLTGLFSLVLAAVLAFDPRSGILSLVWVVGIYAIAGGISELVFAFRLRNLRQRLGGSHLRSVHAA